MTAPGCEAAIAALDRALEDRGDKVYGRSAQIVRCLVQIRGELTANGGKARAALSWRAAMPF